MFFVTGEGRKIRVDNNALSKPERLVQNIGLFTDDVGLKAMWVVHVERYDQFARQNNKEVQLEFCKEYLYDREPTEADILYVLSQSEGGRSCIAYVDKVFAIDY